ncbi:hypothetical protein QYH69_27925 [Paraburkholderia sp. SARCC-3016]|jgi:hypothetical protein|uniref:hypothetical protein n=1 Tax=Paraburkholderia sp. SARCC-3016 TaxID=3058611 RepID=UPI002809D04D|nr:hypothetical protein [Paraburkholderia sp. SARCC-3016]MDQ7981069.1 hypothetical protein [Paraburkholderia sp. SARCC-3016]
MVESFAFAYWVSLFVLFAVFAVTGMFGIGAVFRTLPRVGAYPARALGAVAGAVLGFALLGALPIFG